MRNWAFGGKTFSCFAFIAILIGPYAALADDNPAATTTPVPPVPPGPLWFWIGAIFFLAVLAFFLFYLVPYTNIVRDQGPNPGPSTYKTYSLARCQMALWFFVVLGSFLLIYLEKGDDTLSKTALIVMGISFGTTAAAKTVDAGKVAQAQSQQNAIAPKLAEAKAQLQKFQSIAPQVEDGHALVGEAQAEIVNLQKQLNDAQQAAMPQPSEAFVPDLLTDDGGAALHRFQMAVWTLVIAAMFIHDVYVNLAMPNFPDTLLGLMGISNGLYVGLKIPEK